MRIDACFDSHVHWAATGEFHQRLGLKSLKSAGEILSLSTTPAHRRGDWLLGFGWDDNAWIDQPQLALLDQWQPGIPVALSRADGHAYWCNSEALRRAGILNAEGKENEVVIPSGGRLERDSSGRLTGVLVDQAMEIIARLIPRASGFELRRHLMDGLKQFNQAGYTHIRDMTCDESQWNEAVRIFDTGLLTLAVEEYFWLKRPTDLDSVLTILAKAKSEAPPLIRVMGLKIFLDGALGSEGAWLSRCYCGSEHHGLRLWDDQALKEVLLKTWEKGFAVAVHAIGDAAVDRLVQVAGEIFEEGKGGSLHIEHGELIQAKTIEVMRAQIEAGGKVEVHMQPAHWLEDQFWLAKKVGDLLQCAFPWRKLQEAGIPFDFGSDAPIAPTSTARIFEGLRQSSAAGIPRLLGLASSYMGHRDLSWAANSYTLLEEEKPKVVVFQGEHLI